MTTKTPSDSTLLAQLALLNEEVKAALAKRRAWMDAHMEDFSKFKVGDEVYDCDTGALLGTVSKLYRYWAERDPRYDTQMAVEIEYKVPGGYFDNSSRHGGGGPNFGTKEEAAASLKSRAEYLAWKARGEDWTEVFK